MRLGDIDLPAQSLANAHAAGETVLLTTDGEAVFGYHNTTAAAVTINRGVTPGNFFAPGALVYPAQQPTVFQPCAHENMVRVRVISDLRSNSGNMTVPTWYLNGSQATSTANAGQGCATITYQGRLSDAGSAANGQFDLQLQAFETETGGAAQSDLITLENVQVTNGIFTVPLFFGSTLNNNYKLRFLQIGVRPGTSTGAFTVLTPRQPLTQVPYAINAQNAVIATTAIMATTATTATNATQLGGVPAVNHLTNTSLFGQSVTTVSGTAGLNVTSATTAYTPVPGLTQTVNVPANSSLLISTDGGIQSSGGINTFSVVDAAILVDGIAVSQRRIVVSNFTVAASVDNWALSHGVTLPAGNHVIEIKVKYGGGQSALVSFESAISLLQGKLTVAVIKN